jgi:ABC-type branched-subunit amino acid transport system permease subunit
MSLQGISRDTLLIGALVIILVGALLAPGWIRFLLQVSMSAGLVALGVMLQMRLGLVSFGQGLYYCIGGYTAAMLAVFAGVTDILVLTVAGIVASGAVAFVAGFLMRRYRGIFFAMLSLALSMILYGVLVKARALGSTDGFNIHVLSILGFGLQGEVKQFATYVLTICGTLGAVLAARHYLASSLGVVAEAIRENELRVEYLGSSARVLVHYTYVLAALVSGLGGVLSALAIGHVDPLMVYWSTSGQFVFVALLSGTVSVVAPLIGMFLLESLRIFAMSASPNTWQIILGTVMLAVIIFIPKGLFSLIMPRAQGGKS